MTDMGPQKGPASLPQIQAQLKRIGEDMRAEAERRGIDFDELLEGASKHFGRSLEEIKSAPPLSAEEIKLLVDAEMQVDDMGNSREFEGIGPDGKPATFRFAEGRWYSYVCPDCGETNGGGIETEKHPASNPHDLYSPDKVPCIWCRKGPMVVKYENQEG